MTADPFSPRAPEPDEPSRVRTAVAAVFLFLATLFLYQSMDRVEQANEQAERRQRLAQSACRPYWMCPAMDDEDPADAQESPADDTGNTPAAGAAATTAPTDPVQVLPASIPQGTP